MVTLFFLASDTTHAQFSGAYAPSNWGTASNNSNGSVITSGAPSQIVIQGSDNNSGTQGKTDFSMVVRLRGLSNFSWSSSTVVGPM
jgi:hypothetical protein